MFPLLAEPESYRACSLDLRVEAEPRAYWLDLYARCHPGILEEAIEVVCDEGESLSEARARAATCQSAYDKHIANCTQNYASMSRLDVHTLACDRERIQREHGFIDPYRLVKARENERALSLLPALLDQLDALPDPQRAVEVARGVFAGNIFDVGATDTLELFKSGQLDFHATRDKLKPRPWLVDDLDSWVNRVTSDHPYRHALLFVDNAGCDIVLGMIPFACDLLRRGSSVILTSNTRPALNDIIHPELIELVQQVASIDPMIAEAVKDRRLTCVPSGNTSSLIDLSDVSDELIAAARGTPIDLVVLEGMGRALESNFDARFTCDALKMGMIKDPDVAREYQADLYDLVLRFEPLAA